MKLFNSLYDIMIRWAKHRFAVFALCLVSLIESIFFPIPVDIMLIPIAMAEPQKALRFAVYTTFASVFGGLIGYLLGYYAFDLIKQYMMDWGYIHPFEQAISWFQHWGILVIFVAGFSPIPYKIFTIGAGVMNMAIFPFLMVSLVARFLRFVLVAKLAAWGGQRFATQLRQYIEYMGWGVVILAIATYLIMQ